MVFVMRKLDRAPQALGEKLRALRRGQAVTLDMLVVRTQIQKKYLHALERGEYDKLPEPIYTRQFVRMYASVLGADIKYFLELYDEECGRCDLLTPMQAPRKRLQKYILLSWNRVVAYASIGIIVAALLLYVCIQVIGVFTAPKLEIVTPVETQSVTARPLILIEGSAEEGSTVLINGTTVPLSEKNEFSVEVPLQRGVNIIEVEAIRRYSARARTIHTVVYEDVSTAP